jgi:hypothetical protein
LDFRSDGPSPPHQSIRVTEKHYAPFVKARQEQLEDDVRRTRIPEKKRARIGHVKLSKPENRKKANKSEEINGAGGGNRTHGLGIMRPSLYH